MSGDSCRREGCLMADDSSADCRCGPCRDRRFYLKRADDFRRMAEGLECLHDAARRIARDAICNGSGLDGKERP